MYVELGGAYAFLLVMLRMTGLLTFNPIFSRQNVPVYMRMGLAFFISILLMGTIPVYPAEPSLLGLAVHAVFELLIGAMIGLVIRLFLSVLVVGGEMIDMQLGLSMSKAFDPGSNASISITSNFLNAMFYLMFFMTNSHQTFLRIAAQTFKIYPIGTIHFQPRAYFYIAELLTTVLILAVNLSMPVIIIEMIVTMAVGIIMRVVPQINIFTVNIQVKMLIGALVLFLLIPSFAGFMETLITLCFERVADVLLM